MLIETLRSARKAALLAVLVAACSPADRGDEAETSAWSTAQLERICLGVGAEPVEPCEVVESGTFGEGIELFYALYDLSDAAPPVSQDSTFIAHRRRNAGAIFERVGSDRWTPIWQETRGQPSDLWLEPPAAVARGADTLLIAPVRLYGTGSLNEDAVLVRRSGVWRAVDATGWIPAMMRRLPPGLLVRRGVPVDPVTLRVEGRLWTETDANCCASGGRFEARLELVGDSLVPVEVRYVPGGSN